MALGSRKSHFENHSCRKKIIAGSQPNFFLNSTGQAALTDALYFLMIVSGLSTMLFFYAANYGIDVQQRILDQYLREYTTSALETILYSSTPRIAGENLDDTTEVDYLLAAVKEDFADDSKLVETKAAIAQNIEGIMQPIAGSYDYMFYIYKPDTKQFAYVMIYTRTREESLVKAQIYFCQPDTFDGLQRIPESVGSTSASPPIRVQLVELDERGDSKYPVAEVALKTWIPAPIEQFLQNLNCETYKTISAES